VCTFGGCDTLLRGVLFIGVAFLVVPSGVPVVFGGLRQSCGGGFVWFSV